MNDIDFDELDRAVNSLASQPTGKTDGPAPAASPSTEPASPVPASPQSVVDSSIPPVAAPTVPSAPRPDTGRFMDVVHPSSDMRSSISVPPRAPNREAAPIQPPTLSSADDSASTPPTPAADSPFLPDAKVDKRPLGAFADATPDPVPEPTPPTDPVPPLTTESGTGSSDQPTVNDTPLPRELQDDLLLVETNEETPTTPQESAVAGPEPAMPKESETPSPSLPSQPTSILQQYVEKNDAPAAPTTSIFDVQNYQKVGAKKKKSGWLVVLWIVLLIVLGAGAGAAIYFYVLPLL